MRLVVTGSTGQLGRELVALARRQDHEVLGLSTSEADPCDLTDRGSVLARLRAWRPDLVIHTASSTDVDGCERDPAMARALNVDATRHVASATAAVDAHLVYLSTNHVFDGRSDHPAREADAPNPQSVYAATKLAGEEIAGPDATVVRTAWLSSRYGPNLVTAILDAARRTGELRFTPDEIGQPTFAHDLAPVLLRLGAARASGCWHATNEGVVSSFEFAREVLAAAGHDPSRVVAVPADELPARAAARPRNGALDTAHLRADGGGGLPHHAASLAALIEQVAAG